MSLEIILSVFVGMFMYNIILSAFGKVLLKYFLDNSDTIQKEKKSFQEKLKEKSVQ